MGSDQRWGVPSPDQYGTMTIFRADVLYGLLYFTTNRPIVKFLATFPATFPDTYGGTLVTEHTDENQQTILHILYFSASRLR